MPYKVKKVFGRTFHNRGLLPERSAVESGLVVRKILSFTKFCFRFRGNLRSDPSISLKK